MSFSEKMTSIADNIREKTGVSEPLSLEDMASGINEVFEAGKKAEYDAFWDTFQNYGNRTNYLSAFSQGFPNDAYNPKYDLRGNLSGSFAMSKITDTKVGLINCTVITQAFRYNTAIERIPELNISESTDVGSDKSPFLGATKLSDITMTGVLAKSIIFSSCPLSVTSLKSIISCMKDFSGTENEYTCTITFNSNYFSKLEEEGNASPNGNTWAEYVDDLKWNLTLA